ncbi:hypothetical protein A2U01_0076199 [Trifolium medium]|uniref:Uncharacterized protein n=1 Tax=Trifolium medium TaxID=97028 RepID=A0A392T1Q9_9FABA|nr:hypothetical protein [Trifolium medium]
MTTRLADYCATRATGLRNAPRPEALALNGVTRAAKAAQRAKTRTHGFVLRNARHEAAQRAETRFCTNKHLF